MRNINVLEIENAVCEMCIAANYSLSSDMKAALDDAGLMEKSSLGKQILWQLQDNLAIAQNDQIPICQDTGMAVVFFEIGQDVHVEGGSITDAINEGVRRGYAEGYLRKSVVGDPLKRVNTGDNTPAVIHYDIVPGDTLRITVAPKGFGSENMSRVFMLRAEDRHIYNMERELLEMINRTGIGPAGLGGTTTALAVNILTYPTHIAGLPVAVNICCHVNRHESRVL